MQRPARECDVSDRRHTIIVRRPWLLLWLLIGPAFGATGACLGFLAGLSGSVAAVGHNDALLGVCLAFALVSAQAGALFGLWLAFREGPAVGPTDTAPPDDGPAAQRQAAPPST